LASSSFKKALAASWNLLLLIISVPALVALLKKKKIRVWIGRNKIKKSLNYGPFSTNVSAIFSLPFCSNFFKFQINTRLEYK
jgi:hypothetical protein